jgi:hypothetical protein
MAEPRRIDIQTTVTAPAFAILMGIDHTLAGTPDYMGFGFFWNREYRHLLRDVSPAVRRRVHHRLLKARLKVDEASARHDAVILKTLRIR